MSQGVRHPDGNFTGGFTERRGRELELEMSMHTEESSFVDDGKLDATIWTQNYPREEKQRFHSLEARRKSSRDRV
jgi:hypothetical protein